MAVLRKHVAVRVMAIVTAGTFLSACMTWQTQSLEPERFRSADSTETVRLVLSSGATLVVHAPVIAGDSLVGMTELGSPDSLYHRVSVPLTAISDVQKNDGGAAAALLLVGLAAAVAIYASSHPCYVC